MVGVSKKTPEEIQAQEEKRREYTKEYYSKPQIKRKQKEYYKKYFSNPDNKESHRQAQERYILSQKGQTTRAIYLSNPRQNKQDNEKDRGLSLDLD